MNSSEELKSRLSAAQTRALVIGVVFLALTLVESGSNSLVFFQSYLTAFLFWLELTLGCMGLLMISHLVTATWAFTPRRIAEAAMHNMVPMLVLFIPLLWGFLTGRVQPAAEGEAVSHFHAVYASHGFLAVRALVYFAIWIVLAHFLYKWSGLQDETGDPALQSKLEALSGPGILVFGLTVTFASIDWVMTLEPYFFSTIYGMIYMVGPLFAAMCFVLIAEQRLAPYEPISKMIKPQLLNDQGNLLLVFTILWAYLAYSQYVIIWAGNQPDEIPWYLRRGVGPWAAVALFLIVFHFGLPFVLLLNRPVKRSMRLISGLAAGLFAVAIIDTWWMVAPAYSSQPRFHWSDWTAVIGIGALWIWRLSANLKTRPLLPLNDPRFSDQTLMALGRPPAGRTAPDAGALEHGN